MGDSFIHKNNLVKESTDMENLQFDYFYGDEAEQFVFYRIPKILVKSPHFRKVSDSAKILYSLMLDRMGLSIKNGWVDE